MKRSYYYPLILYFVPFRDESTLLLKNENVEEAFNCLLPSNRDCSAYHARLQKILQSQSDVKKINDAGQAEGKEEKISKEDGDIQLIGEAKMAMQEVLDLNINMVDDALSLEDRVVMLKHSSKACLIR